MKSLSSKVRKYFHQNHRRKRFQPKEIDADKKIQGYRTPIRLDQKRKSTCHIIIITQNLENKERILKAAREKGQVISRAYLSELHSSQHRPQKLEGHEQISCNL